jgi:exopolysaccharide biosynthesis polyprenyl glycosylphosphotransferase
MNIARSNNLITQSKSGLNDGYLDINSEDDFIEMLSQERKRSIRSNQPYLLILLNIEKIIRINSAQAKIKTIVSSLNKSTREIDIKGWYKQDAVIGVICIEIEEPDIHLAKNIIADRINKNLSAHLLTELLNMITITYHIFPEKLDANEPDNCLDPMFYPELPKLFLSNMTDRILKRLVDVIGSIFGLIVFSPLFLIIPLLIKLSSKGPVFFKQQRVGQFGKIFTFLKFRSMYINNDSTLHREYVTKLIKGENNCAQTKDVGEMCPVYKIKSDPRITPIGRYLRKSSLDEIPQFLNVLTGDMSLVGPRPPIPYEFEKYDPWHRERLLKMKPGITGLWQIMGRSSTSFDEMVRLDVKYIKEWSLWLDVVILFKTPWVVLTGKGAY